MQSSILLRTCKHVLTVYNRRILCLSVHPLWQHCPAAGSLLEEDTDCHSQDMDETQRDDTASEEAHLADRQAQVRENLDLTEGAKHVPKDLEVHLNCSWPEPHTSYSTVAWGAIVSDTVSLTTAEGTLTGTSTCCAPLA